MARLPRVTGKEVVRALEKAGFEVIRVTGSHFHLHRWEGDRWGPIVTVPRSCRQNHLSKMLKRILKQAGLTVEEFLELLKSKVLEGNVGQAFRACRL